MKGIGDTLANLPRSTQAALLLGGVAGVAALITAFGGTRVMWVVLGGVVLACIVLVVCQALAAGLEGRRSAPMQRDIFSNASMSPTAVSEPARRARLDDLRKNFEQGIEKFRAAGKNIYGVPWYLLVGEPGSGKTEAVRHCNVGFPPGLQDELQGAGGTLNMNWWFTNQAVILDTAGRLMFEEVEPGATSEWTEFLRLLRRNRPTCPVNGMLLVIPSESLVRDTNEQIEHKASRIARQLDTIQRALGVRFPVFVVVTKCDLLVGFREFFDTVDDPALQHQMLGWSNPDPLDAPFRPELVDRHLTQVRERLARRRGALLADPVHTENPKGRRIDQVDALFALPESIVKLAPRLRRYLEMIFSSGEWSARPLFLRGIYFTSAMREGSALDADLAQALGVPVESLPEGRVWERDRSYFLRDLFINKVFRERGLVTSAASASGLQRARRAAVYGLAGLGVVGLGVLTLLGARGLEREIVPQRDFWNLVREAYEKGVVKDDATTGRGRHVLPIVQKLLLSDADYKYRGDAGADAGPVAAIKDGDADGTRAKAPLVLQEWTARRISVPTVFAPASLLVDSTGGDLLRNRRIQATRSITEASVVRPVLEAAVERIERLSRDPEGEWGPEAAAALAELIRLHSMPTGASTTNTSPGEPPRLAPLLRFALLGNSGYEAEGAAADAEALQAHLRWLYEPSTAGPWPTPSALPEGSLSGSFVRRGVEALIASYDRRVKGRGGEALRLTQLAEAMGAFADSERSLLAIADMTDQSPGQLTDAWRDRYLGVREAADELESLLGGERPQGLGRALEESAKTARAEYERVLELLLSQARSAPAGDADAEKITQLLQKAQQALAEAGGGDDPSGGRASELRGRLARLEASMLGPPGEAARFSGRMSVYSLVAERLDELALADPSEPAPSDAVKDLARARELVGRPGTGEATELAQRALATAKRMLEAAYRRFKELGSPSPASPPPSPPPLPPPAVPATSPIPPP